MPEIINLALPISDRTDPRLVPISRGGGTSLNGQEQVLSPLTSVWRWKAVLPIHNAGGARSWRAVRAQLKGRWNYLRVRVCDQYRISRASVGATYDGKQVPYSDGAFHSDGTGFKLAQPNAPLLVPAARGATSISLPASAFTGAMSAGLFFSIDDRLYVVTDWEQDGAALNLTFEPPLRAAADEGDTADFDAKAIWTLESDDTGTMDLRLGRFGSVELNLVEPLGRL